MKRKKYKYGLMLIEYGNPYKYMGFYFFADSYFSAEKIADDIMKNTERPDNTIWLSFATFGYVNTNPSNEVYLYKLSSINKALKNW